MAAVAAGAGVALAVAAAGGTYALLNSQAVAAAAVTLTSGDASLAVTTALSLPTTALYPGATVSGSAVVKNTGTIPLKLRVTGLTLSGGATSFSGALTVGVAAGASAAACSGGFTPEWTGVFASAPAAELSTTLAAGASVFFCVSAALPTGAPDAARGSSAASFAVLIDGRQL
ncbi:hypothetical protein VD659_13860 [Herbiconiux sp. 11R-BC]|uniref:hypothetical protein n=1 Tax=Herbiconiux sp. 11R-BC TaxID=3111637 RepID=UPI003BFF799A